MLNFPQPNILLILSFKKQCSYRCQWNVIILLSLILESTRKWPFLMFKYIEASWEVQMKSPFAKYWFKLEVPCHFQHTSVNPKTGQTIINENNRMSASNLVRAASLVFWLRFFPSYFLLNNYIEVSAKYNLYCSRHDWFRLPVLPLILFMTPLLSII